MHIDRGFPVKVETEPLSISYGPGVFGPQPEYRHLAAIRSSLLDPTCEGPDPVYVISMDVGRNEDRFRIQARNLLFGVVAYAAGRLGSEPVRSQGHVHKLSRNSGWAAPEIFEVWHGRAIIYMQGSVDDDPVRCLAIDAGPGDKVVVPPAWAHAVISADPTQPLVFGAWCDRDYGFVYERIRAHGGLGWFPCVNEDGTIHFVPNQNYLRRNLERRTARFYPELGILPGVSLYDHLRRCPEGIEWIADPSRLEDAWTRFEP
jgi:glucose-6-phosphate isomerase, archaeal